MEKLKTLINDYFYLIAFFFLGMIALLSFFIGSDYFASREADKFNKTITNQTTEANTAVNRAANSEEGAAIFSNERRTEDTRRQSLKPRLTEARSNSSVQ